MKTLEHKLFSACFAVLVASSAHANDFAAKGPRPISEAVDYFEHQYNVAINYEDKFYRSSADIGLFRQTALQFLEIEVHPQAPPTFRDVESRSADRPYAERQAAALQQLSSVIAIYTASNHTINFGIFQDSNGLTVRPVEQADKSDSSPGLSYLDQRISIKAVNKPYDTVVDEIVARVGGVQHPLFVGLIPTGIQSTDGSSTWVTLDMKNVPARQILAEVIRQRFPNASWRILCGPPEGRFECALNIVQRH